MLHLTRSKREIRPRVLAFGYAYAQMSKVI